MKAIEYILRENRRNKRLPTQVYRGSKVCGLQVVDDPNRPLDGFAKKRWQVEAEKLNYVR